MIAYKGFSKDLSCTHNGNRFQYKLDVINITEAANCAQNGFHCAEDPLDCLSYYSNWNNSLYYIVEASGDIDEDGTDTKISCTEMTLIKRLDLQEFVYESLLFMKRYPLKRWNYMVKKDKGHTNESSYGFVIVRGNNPMAAGTMEKVLGLIRQDTSGTCIIDVIAVIVDGIFIKENTWYTVQDGKVMEVTAA